MMHWKERTKLCKGGSKSGGGGGGGGGGSATQGELIPPGESLQDLRKAVIQEGFGEKNLKGLMDNPNFKLYKSGIEGFDPKSRESWLKAYREWVGVPKSEIGVSGPTVIRGIDVMKNFRPWHVFNLDPKTATKEDINRAFKKLAMQHHPDHGGNAEVFMRLKKMRDSILAFR